jgi:hypothetical protein
MRWIGRVSLVAAAAVAVVVGVSAFAQQPSLEQGPTKKDPLRFDAFAVQMQGGRAGSVQIVIERWSTDQERQMLIGLIGTKETDRDAQSKLIDGLQGIKERCGYIRTPNSMGWDLKYAKENMLPDGTRQIVVVTDKPVSFVAARAQTRTMDYPFSLIEMRFPPDGGKGEGKLLSQTSMSIKDGRLQLEIYGQEPTRLTNITERKKKGAGE